MTANAQKQRQKSLGDISHITNQIYPSANSPQHNPLEDEVGELRKKVQEGNTRLYNEQQKNSRL